MLPGPGEGQVGSCCSMGIMFPSCKMKNSRDLLNNVVLLNSAVMYMQKFNRVDLMLCAMCVFFFYHDNKHIKMECNSSVTVY